MTIIYAGSQKITMYLIDGLKYYTVEGESAKIPFSFPTTFRNIRNDGKKAKVNFATDLVVDNDVAFIIDSENFEFDGEFHYFIIQNVFDFRGLFINGVVSKSKDDITHIFPDQQNLNPDELDLYVVKGNSGITINNFKMDEIDSTLYSGSGWLGEQGFGTHASENVVEYCSNVANIPDNCGGLLGNYTAYRGNALLRKSSNAATIIGTSGGLVGLNAGDLGTVRLNSCYNIGNLIPAIISSKIGGGGGLIGYNPSPNGGNIHVENCYSQGIISYVRSGGLIGYFNGLGKIFVKNSYTLFGKILSFTETSKINVTLEHTYNPYNVWDNDEAKKKLLGSPKSYYEPGSIWRDPIEPTPQTPWILNIFRNPSTKYVTTTADQITIKVDDPSADSPTQTPTPTQNSDNLQIKNPNPTILSKISTYAKWSINGSDPKPFKNVKVDPKNGNIVLTHLRTSPIRTYVINRFSYENAGRKFFNYYWDKVEVHSKNQIAPICFPENTPIKTDQGVIEIQKIDTLYHTIDSKKIIAITQTISNDKYLVCFEKDSLSENVPSEQTIMSKEHKVFYNNELIEADKFVGKFKNVKKIDYDGKDLYNVLMEKHEKMNVNNMICETLHPENFVARLYNNKLGKIFKDILLNKINETIENNDSEGYKKAVHVLRKASFLKDALDNNMIRKEPPVKAKKITGLKNMKF